MQGLLHEEAWPISAEKGLADIGKLGESDDGKIREGGERTLIEILDDYTLCMLEHVDTMRLKSWHSFVNEKMCAGGATLMQAKIKRR